MNLTPVSHSFIIQLFAFTENHLLLSVNVRHHHTILLLVSVYEWTGTGFIIRSSVSTSASDTFIAKRKLSRQEWRKWPVVQCVYINYVITTVILIKINQTTFKY